MENESAPWYPDGHGSLLVHSGNSTAIQCPSPMSTEKVTTKVKQIFRTCPPRRPSKMEVNEFTVPPRQAPNAEQHDGAQDRPMDR